MFFVVVVVEGAGFFLGGICLLIVCFCFSLSFFRFLMGVIFSVYSSDVIAGKVIDHIFTFVFCATDF